MNVHNFTLYDMFRRNAAIYGQRPAILHDQGRLTFRAFLARVDALAAGLAGLAMEKGERICILAQNHLSYLDLYGACAKLGYLAYPINWRLTADEVGRVVERAEPRMVVVDDTTLQLVTERLRTSAHVHRYRFGSTSAAGFTAFDTLYDDVTPSPSPMTGADDPFAVISTAAVDVIPRGAVLTHANLLAANLQSMACMGLGESDCHLLALPLFHVAALGAALATMHAGGASVLMTRFDTEQAVRLIDAHQVTYLTSFPPILNNLLDAAQQAGITLSSLRHVTGIETPETVQRLHATTPAQFWSGFGQSETSGFVTLQRYVDHPGSAGKPGPLCRVALVDEQDREVPIGTPGEIVVQGPMVFQGYFRQPEVNAYTFRGGWHHTGDVGRFDEEGYLYYMGRTPEKELIKPGGENVYPAEVESVIRELEGVAGVCVFGVPDAQWGEAIKAVVEVVPGTPLSAQQVSNYVASKIARYKRPKWVDFTETLPKNAQGLIDRAAVKLRWGEVG